MRRCRTNRVPVAERTTLRRKFWDGEGWLAKLSCVDKSFCVWRCLSLRFADIPCVLLFFLTHHIFLFGFSSVKVYTMCLLFWLCLFQLSLFNIQAHSFLWFQLCLCFKCRWSNLREHHIISILDGCGWLKLRKDWILEKRGYFALCLVSDQTAFLCCA